MNQLMQPQVNVLQTQQLRPQQPQNPQPNQQQIQDAHARMTESLNSLNKLIKLPYDRLNFHTLIDSAADEVEKFQLSGGKVGLSAMSVAAEMSDPNFPTVNSSAQQIRQFLQNRFDQIIALQAHTTSRFGAPQQQAQEGQMQ